MSYAANMPICICVTQDVCPAIRFPSAHGSLAVRETIIATASTKQEPTLDHLPDRDLLDATHTFPGSYVFKAIGAADGHFVGRVVSAVRSELGEEIEPSFSTRTTAGGRHVCVTIEPPVEDADDVLAIYSRIREVEGLVLLL